MAPLPGLALVATAGTIWQRRRWARSRHAARQADAEVALLAELTGLGLTAGLPLTSALAAAAEEAGDLLAREVRGVLRRARVEGTAVALGTSEGRAQPLYRLAARAVVTGAPLRPAVAAFADQVRGEERAKRLAAARKLPVRLLLPLSLLILPGFVLLSLGPALIGALERLDLTLPPAIGRLPI
jgi:predicted amidohydrolase